MTCSDSYSSFSFAFVISYVILCNVLFAYLILLSIWKKFDCVLILLLILVRPDLTWELKLFCKFT